MTELIDEILSCLDGLDPSIFRTLDEADRLDAFNRAVDPADPGSGRALAILAHSDPGPGGLLAGAVAQIAADPEGISSAIVSALSQAAAIGPDAVPIALGLAAAEPDTVTALAAWRTLQHVANGEQLPDLEAAAPPIGNVVGDQAAFALSVVAYRSGISGYELTVPSEAEYLGVEYDEPVVPVSQSGPTAEDFEMLELIPSGELYLISPTMESTSAIECGEDRMLICLDAGVQESLPATLWQGPALAGVVVLLGPHGVSYSVRYLILTWPDEEGGFHVALHHADGAQVYYGHAGNDDITGSEADLGLFLALNRPGVERTAITVSVSPAGVKLGGDMVSAAEISGDRLEPEPT